VVAAFKPTITQWEVNQMRYIGVDVGKRRCQVKRNLSTQKLKKMARNNITLARRQSGGEPTRSLFIGGSLFYSCSLL